MGLKVCVPHACPYGQDVDAWGLHALVCKHAPGRIQRHHALIDTIACTFTSAGVPVSKEPSGLFPDDTKKTRRPDLNTVAGREGFDLGRHSCVYAGRLLYSKLPPGAAAELAATRNLPNMLTSQHLTCSSRLLCKRWV